MRRTGDPSCRTLPPGAEIVSNLLKRSIVVMQTCVLMPT